MLSHPRIMESEFIGMPSYKNNCESWKLGGWHKTGINSESLSVFFFKDPRINRILFAMLVLLRKKTALKEMIRGKRAASEKCHWTKISWNLRWDAMPASWLRHCFWDQSFRDRYRDFFSRPNVFETDTETFFQDQIFSRPILRLFFETKYFRDRYRDFFSWPKFSRPRPILSKNWEKSRYREVSRRDVTLC